MRKTLIQTKPNDLLLDEFKNFNKIAYEKKQKIINSALEEFSKKSYSEANTDNITKNANISKGILFHYFGNKKNLYLYLLDYSVNLLVEYSLKTKETKSNSKDDLNFYSVFFCSMDEKINVCIEHPLETMFVNAAAKENNSQIVSEKNALLSKYAIKIQASSIETLKTALSAIKIKKELELQLVTKALALYSKTIISMYLEKYINNPVLFFKEKNKIQNELKSYFDLFLFGIC